MGPSNSVPSSVTDTNLDKSTIYTPTATSENTSTAHPETHGSSSNVPSHGHTVIIRCITSGQVITLVDGEVVLASPGGRGSIHWECVESVGWHGFRNTVSDKFLCHHVGDVRIRCIGEPNSKWRYFTVTPVPEGGHVMQMLDWFTLRSVVVAWENGLQKMSQTGNRLEDGIRWEFVRVEHS